MTKTVETVTGLPRSQKDLLRNNHGDKNNSRESSESPPLVLKYLETLPPEKEVTLLVEVVQAPKTLVNKQKELQQKAPKVIAELPVVHVQDVASVVKAEINDTEDQDLDEDEEEDEECFNIIEENVIDASTLPGRTVLAF